MRKQNIEKAVVYQADKKEEKFFTSIPKQIHEILIENSKMENPVISHSGTESIFFSKKDWVYECKFSGDKQADRSILTCKGLDTIVDLWLNGIKIGEHRDMFFPFQCDITDKIQEENSLVFYFHSPLTYLDNLKEPQEWKGKIPKSHYIRKAVHDYADFLGIKPYYCPVGIFDTVQILEYEKGRIDTFRIDCSLSMKKGTAEIKVRVEGEWFHSNTGEVIAVLENPDGKVIGEKIKNTQGKFQEQIHWEIENPQLWYPSGYGEQALYKVKLFLEQCEVCLEQQEKSVGIRKIQYGDNFQFWINGEKIRLWGANVVPVNGVTHCFDKERTYTLIKRAKEANMNVLRLWGGGEPFSEEIYEMADQEGLLIWVEFFHNYGMYPDSKRFMNLYRKEAEYMTETLAHHACVFMWSGGNECHMAAELLQPGERYIGEKIFQMYEAVVKKSLPDIFYQKNSPWGGSFYNDPRTGDMHGWNNIWYVPYEKYPVFFSENSRVSPPVYRSLKSYIPDDDEFWPKGFIPRRTKYTEELFPPSWMKLSGGPETYRCSPIEEFYDSDTPEQLIHQCQAAHARSMKEYGERIKRGKTSTEKKIRCQGELIWKLNDTWPQIFTGLLDYDLEPGMAYFAVKRVFEQIQISFQIEDHIEVWGINDSNREVEGILETCVFDMEKNRILYEKRKSVNLLAKNSTVLADLDEYPMFYRKNVLYACLKGKKGEIICRNYDFLEIERNLPFPEASIELRQEGEYIVVSTDQYAHCIELLGKDGSTEKGFVFEDNYFELMPFETRKIRVEYSGEDFEITAQSMYSARKAVLYYKKPEEL